MTRLQAAIKGFEYAVRLHEGIGSHHPAEHEWIEAYYELWKLHLKMVAKVVRSTKETKAKYRKLSQIVDAGCPEPTEEEIEHGR